MAETDETVGSMLYCISTTMRSISWSFTPQINGQDAPDHPEARKYADIAQSMLDDINQPFDDHVDDHLTMLWAGFAPVEIVTKRRDGVNSRYSDGYYGIKALNLLDQTTILDFVYDGDEITHMKQMGLGTNGNGLIPMSKVLNFRTSTQYNRPRGRPLLKSAWRVWRLKRKIQDSEALGIERELCGLPIFEMPEEVINAQFETDAGGEPTEDAMRARAMVLAAQSATRDMRLNKSGGLVLPSDTWGDEYQGGGSQRRYNFRIQTTGGQRSIDSRTAARDYDHAIARVAMMQFLTLGQRSGGSYALSDDQSSMAVSSITALADRFVATWNKTGVPLLWRVNAFPMEYMPSLSHSEVNKNGIVQLGQFLSGIGKAADLWGGDPVMRRAIANAGNLPYSAEAQDEAASNFRKKQERDGQPPAPPTQPGATPEGDDEED